MLSKHVFNKFGQLLEPHSNISVNTLSLSGITYHRPCKQGFSAELLSKIRFNWVWDVDHGTNMAKPSALDVAGWAKLHDEKLSGAC